MPDLDDQLRELASVSEPDRRPLAADVLHARARHVRRARRVRLVVPAIVVLVAIVGAGVVLRRGRDSALDVGNLPSPRPVAVQQTVDRLTAVADLRHALALEALATADTTSANPGRPPTDDLVAARIRTDDAVTALRAEAGGDPALAGSRAWAGVQTRLDQFPVTRRSADQGQTEVIVVIDQYHTTLSELDRMAEEVPSAAGGAADAAFDRWRPVAERTDAQAMTWATAAIAVRTGFFPSVLATSADPVPRRTGIEPPGCGVDAAAGGASCDLYSYLQEQFDRSGTGVDDPTLDTLYGDRLHAALAAGQNGNDLGGIDAGQFAADARSHLEARFALERRLLDQI